MDLFLVVNQIFDSRQVEAQRETEGVIQRIGGCRGNYVGYIQREDTQVETGTHCGIAAVAFPSGFVAVTGAGKELLIVRVLSTNSKLDFLQFFNSRTNLFFS